MQIVLNLWVQARSVWGWPEIRLCDNPHAMQKTLQKFLLIVFMLLQCLAPLAHAHVDGIDAGHGLYSHDLSAQQDGDSLEAYEGAVVSVQCAYLANQPELLADPHSETLAIKPIQAASVDVSTHVPTYPHLATGRANYVLAWSQAPPRIILSA